MKKIQSFILFILGLLTGVLFYWLASVTLFAESGKSALSSRMVASSDARSSLKDCEQIQTITDKENIDIYCSFVTRKTDKGIKYKVRSTVAIKTDEQSKKAVISVSNALKDKSEHITEADYCGGEDCIGTVTVDVENITDLNQVSQALKNKVSNILNKEDDRIESAVEDAYDSYKEKQEVKNRIADCEISPKSEVDDIVKISPEEKIKCRKDQLADIENSEDRTKFFHSTVKKDLWHLVRQDKPLDYSVFLSDYMRELDSPDFFDYDYFSVHSSIDTVQKYNELRLFMHELGSDKLAALNAITAQMPFYFYTHNTVTGRQDRQLLEQSWNANFKERPFPSYYSLTVKPKKATDQTAHNRGGLSAQQFKAIVNSPSFKKLYGRQ